MSDEIRQSVYDIWIEHSVNSTDARNGSNTVKITKLQYLRLYSGLQNENIKIEERANKRGSIQYIANRMILTATIRELQDKLLKNDISVSIGSILSLKPFFITYATEKEIALCLCKLCLNAKMMYDALISKAKKEGDTMPASISEFYELLQMPEIPKWIL